MTRMFFRIRYYWNWTMCNLSFQLLQLVVLLDPFICMRNPQIKKQLYDRVDRVSTECRPSQPMPACFKFGGFIEISGRDQSAPRKVSIISPSRGWDSWSQVWCWAGDAGHRSSIFASFDLRNYAESSWMPDALLPRLPSSSLRILRLSALFDSAKCKLKPSAGNKINCYKCNTACYAGYITRRMKAHPAGLDMHISLFWW